MLYVSLKKKITLPETNIEIEAGDFVVVCTTEGIAYHDKTQSYFDIDNKEYDCIQ